MTHQSFVDGVKYVLTRLTRAGNKNIDPSDFVLDPFSDAPYSIPVPQVAFVGARSRLELCTRRRCILYLLFPVIRTDWLDYRITRAQIHHRFPQRTRIIVDADYRAIVPSKLFCQASTQRRGHTCYLCVEKKIQKKQNYSHRLFITNPAISGFNCGEREFIYQNYIARNISWWFWEN